MENQMSAVNPVWSKCEAASLTPIVGKVNRMLESVFDAEVPSGLWGHMDEREPTFQHGSYKCEMIVVDDAPDLAGHLANWFVDDRIAVRYMDRRDYNSVEMSESFLQQIERDIWARKVPMILTVFVNRSPSTENIPTQRSHWLHFVEAFHRRSPIASSYASRGDLKQAMGFFCYDAMRLEMDEQFKCTAVHAGGQWHQRIVQVLGRVRRKLAKNLTGSVLQPE